MATPHENDNASTCSEKEDDESEAQNKSNLGFAPGSQIQPKSDFPASKLATSIQFGATEKQFQNKLHFRRSPLSGRRLRSTQESMKRSGKAYLSDEDGVESEEFSSVRKEEDERNYNSETELDVAWYQSESIEADQYKMDPEVDQPNNNEGDYDGAHSRSERIESDVLHENAEDESEWLNVKHHSFNSDNFLSYSSNNNDSSSNCLFSPCNKKYNPSSHLEGDSDHCGNANISLSGGAGEGYGAMNHEAKEGSIIYPTNRNKVLFSSSNEKSSTSSSISSTMKYKRISNESSGTTTEKFRGAKQIMENIKQSAEINTDSSSSKLSNQLRAFSYGNREDLSDDQQHNSHSKLAFQQTPALSEDVKDIEQQLQGLLNLTDKNLPGRSLYDETSTHEEDNNVIERSKENKKIFKNLKEFLPQSHKYLLEPVFNENNKTASKDTKSVDSDHQSASDDVLKLLGEVDISQNWYESSLSTKQSVTQIDAINIQADNKVLRTSLEEEMFRRKHCEKQILQLQEKMLELQQTVAVAVSLDRQKDDTIRKIDLMLARLVKNWKRKDDEKHELLQKMLLENKLMKKYTKDQQSALVEYEIKWKELNEKLNLEKEKHKILSREFHSKVENLEECIRNLEMQKTEEVASWKIKFEDELGAKWKVEKELLEKLSHVTATHEQEKVNWKIKEENLHEEFNKAKQSYSDSLELEKMKNEKQQNIIEELRFSLKKAQDEANQQKQLLEKLTEENESCKHENSTLDEKHKKELRDCHERISMQAKNEVSEVTRKLVELHKMEMEGLMRTHMEEVAMVKDDAQKEENELIDKLSQAIEEAEKLKQENDNLRLYKQDLASKIQMLLQSQCQEALKLLDNNPVRTSVNPSGEWNPLSNRNLLPSYSSRRAESLSHQSDYDHDPVTSSGECDEDVMAQLSLHHNVNQSERSSSPINLLYSQNSADESSYNLPNKIDSFQTKTQHHKRNEVGLKNKISKLAKNSVKMPDSSRRSCNTSSQRIGNNEFLSGQKVQQNKVEDVPTTDKNFSNESIKPKLRFDEQQTKDPERSKTLQHYIKMMLQHPPGPPMEKVNVRENYENKRSTRQE